MLRLRSLLLGLAMVSAACPKAAEDSPRPPTTPPTTTTPTTPTTLPTATTLPTLPAGTVVPKFDLGQMQSDPEIARRNQEALDKLKDPAANPFEKPCGDPKEVRCKP